jgi:iron complex transport system ATP-binding protein
MISVENITCRSGNKVLLEDISVTFEPGKLNLVIGPNGAGKSTLVKAMCRHVNVVSGRISFGGRDLRELTDAGLARMRAVLSQSVELTFPLKVSEVVMMGRYPHFTSRPGSRDISACDAAMEFFSISDLSERDYMSLSGGEKQRVNFARVIAQIWGVTGESRYLLLDEPLTFLDVQYQFQFIRKMQELLEDKNLTIVGIVHDLNLAARFADKIVLLHKGRLHAAGTVEEVITAANIKAAYGLEPRIYLERGITHLFFE